MYGQTPALAPTVSALGCEMTDTKLNIELLYFEGCPSWQNALQNLEKVLGDLGFPPEIYLVLVETQDQAIGCRFIGSPTIRVNGSDLFPTDQDRYGLACRVYQTPGGLKGWPTEEMVKDRLGIVLKSV